MKLTKIKSLVAAVVSLVSVAALAEEAQTAVQLWEGGPYWATVNVGTSEVQDHPEYGALYAFDKDKAKEAAESIGYGWRLPTLEEFEKLTNTSVCVTSWDDTNKGRTFTGKGDYSSASIFLPAAGSENGMLENGRQSAASKGLYWSSEKKDDEFAYSLSLGKTDARTNYSSIIDRLSVRAVRDTPPSEMVETEIGKDGPKTFCLGPMEGSEGNPWKVGTDGKTPPQYVTAYTNGTELVIGGAGTVAALKDVDGLKDLLANLAAITITEPTVMGAAVNAFYGVKNVNLTLPDGWQGELPDEDEDGKWWWYGAEDVTLMAYPLSVKNVTFQQRYPWNGLVNIDFGVTGPAGETNVVVTAYTNGTVKIADFTAAVMIPDSGVLATNLVWDATAAGLGDDFTSDDVTVEVAFKGGSAGTTLNAVQLWENGPYFAECNVGGTVPGDYGGLYMFDDNKAADAAKSLGDGWRLPSGTELDALLPNCDKKWETCKDSTGADINGYRFTGKDDYSSNSVFLPAAGYDDGVRKDTGDSGRYWSSDADEDDGEVFVVNIFFNEGNASMFNSKSSLCLSVRAVRDTPPAPVISAKSAVGTVDLRTSIALAEGEATVAGVNYSDTAWGAVPEAAVTLGWTNETTGASDVIQTGLEGEGKTDISLPKRNGAYRLTHSTGGLTSFVEFMVDGWPEVKIPVVTGYTYVVSNETAEVTGTLADGTNTYVVAKGSELKVYFTLDKNYQFVGTPENPMTLGAINESKVIDIESLPKAELGPISYLDWDGETMTNAVCKVYEEYTGQTALSAGTTYVVMENKEVSTRITVNGTEASPTRIILCDGAKLTAQAGVNVESDKALVIYGQSESEGMGALTATGADLGCAGIGAGSGGTGGMLTINGGMVTANGGYMGSGIGGGCATYSQSGGGCGAITINGGTVTATGGRCGAGIGGGSDNVDGGTITINGGTVTATAMADGSYIGEAIGRGDSGLVDCTVTFGADKDFILKIGDDAASAVYFPQAQYVTDHSAAYANIKAADVVLLKIPSPTEGFFYAVTNVTDAAGVEVIGTLEDGTYTCAFVNGDSYEVTYTLEYGYDWVTSPASNPMTGTITEDTMLPEVTVMQLGADVEFNAMGGNYSDGSEVVTNFCVLVYTMPATPTRTDYEFLGWYDSWKADAAKVEEGSVLKEYSPHSIYAKWKSTKFEPSEDEEVIKTDGNGVIVAQEVEPTGELILPEMNRGGSSGVANVEIGEDAFLKSTGITSVSLPVFVKKIDAYAFANATGISKIKFVQPRDATTGENTTLTIGDGAFSGLSLTKIELPPYVESIGAKAFAGNTKLTDLTIMGPTTIDWEARPFLNCGTATLDGKVTLHLSYEVATNKDYATKLWNYVKNYADNIVIDFNPYGTAKVLSFGSDFVEFEARIDTPWPTIDINSVKVLTTTELTGADLEKTWTTVPLTNVTPVEGNVYRATFEGQGGGTRFYQIAIVMPAEEN